MFSQAVKDIANKKYDFSLVTKEMILYICASNVDMYQKISSELQQDPDVIYVCLNCLNTGNSVSTLELLFKNADVRNIYIIEKLIWAIDKFSMFFDLPFLVRDPNYQRGQLPYRMKACIDVRNYIYTKTTSKIQKEIVFAELTYKPDELIYILKYIDISKFTIKPCGYDVFIKIE